MYLLFISKKKDHCQEEAPSSQFKKKIIAGFLLPLGSKRYFSGGEFNQNSIFALNSPRRNVFLLRVFVVYVRCRCHSGVHILWCFSSACMWHSTCTLYLHTPFVHLPPVPLIGVKHALPPGRATTPSEAVTEQESPQRKK